MLEEKTIDNHTISEKKSCVQEGFLPVPLTAIPPESLIGLEVYIQAYPSYSLYKSSGLEFGLKDYERLIDAGTEYVYIETKNHQRYYNAVEDTLLEIVNDKSIATERKCEILYATTLALTTELMSTPPDRKKINEVEKLTKSTIDLVLKNPSAINHLYSISNHDFYTATHVANVSILMVSFAHKIGIKDKKLLNDLGTGGLLHDIGKMFIPQNLLNSTDKLSEDDFELIKSHVKKGVDYLEGNADLSDVITKIVSQHHEKLDGSGYPNKLAGDEISVYGRMSTIVDMFEAMTSVRPYRETSMPVAQAMEIIEDMAPDQLDKKFVKSFINFIESNMQGVTDYEGNVHDSDLLNALGIIGDGKENPSGRRHARHYFRVKCNISELSNINGNICYGHEHIIIAHNISQSGIGMLSNRKYDQGQFVSIKINMSCQDKELIYFAKLKRIIDHADGWFTIGAEFVKEQTVEHVMNVYSKLK